MIPAQNGEASRARLLRALGAGVRAVETARGRETWHQDEVTRKAVMYGQADLDTAGSRAALGGEDLLSLAVSGLAARLWNRTGRRGFRGSIVRFRFALLIIIRCLAGGCLLPVLAPAVVMPSAGPAAEPVTVRTIRDQVTGRMTVGPPAVVAAPAAPAIFP